jgi:PAS domain S-box-containing protein
MVSAGLLALLPLAISAIAGLWIYKSAADVAMKSLGNEFLRDTLEATDAIEDHGRDYEGILTALSVMANYLKADNSGPLRSDYLRSLVLQTECMGGCQFGFAALDAQVQGSQRAAMVHALETHAPFVDKDLPLNGPESPIPQYTRLTMYIPVLDNGLQPRSGPTADAVPLVYMSMDAAALAGRTVAPRQTDIAWELFDREQVSADALPLYRSALQTDVPHSPVPLFSSKRSFRFGGKVWTLRFHSLPAFEAGLDVERPQRFLRNILILGLLVSIITWLELSTRRRATRIANRQTSELQKLGRAVDQSPVATVIANVDGQIEYVSAGYTQMSGFSAQDQIGQPIAVLHTQGLSDAEREQLWANVHVGKVWKGALQKRRKNGTLYWESQTISAMNDAEGRISHLLVTKENITERKMAEERLRSSEAFCVAIMESIGDAIVVVNRSGVVLRVNQAWRQFTDESGPCPHAAAVHTGVDCNFLALCEGDIYFSSPTDAVAVREGIKAVLAGRIPSFHYEYPCQTKTGRHWFHLVAMPMAMPADQTGAVISNSDVTVRKVQEVESLQYQFHLEKMVGNSTVQLGTLADQLLNTETRERRSLAEDLHDDLGQSLTVLKLKLQSLNFPQAFEGREQVLKQLSEIESVVDSSSQSVRSISTHLSPPVLHQQGLQAALDWLAEEMQNTYGLTVNIEWDATVHLDESLGGSIYRTVRELLINVWKHADTDSADVSIRLDAYSGMLIVTVVDAGMGFDVAEMQKPSTKLSYGIYSVRERMNLIGGSLKIDSVPGVGTSVVIMIPARAIRHAMKETDSDSNLVGR